MERKAQYVFDLADIDHIWLRPYESAKFIWDFGVDVSGWTFTLYYKEHQWPYMPHSYDTLTAGTITSGFTFTDNEDDVVGAVMNLTIPEPTITSWLNRKIDILLQINDGTDTWIGADRTLTVAQGD